MERMQRMTEGLHRVGGQFMAGSSRIRRLSVDGEELQFSGLQSGSVQQARREVLFLGGLTPTAREDSRPPLGKIHTHRSGRFTPHSVRVQTNSNSNIGTPSSGSMTMNSLMCAWNSAMLSSCDYVPSNRGRGRGIHRCRRHAKRDLRKQLVAKKLQESLL